MADPTGFTYEQRGSEVHVFHHGRRAAILRGRSAADFLGAVEEGADEQLLMAKATGNYKHGNERTARNHPRHRGR